MNRFLAVLLVMLFGWSNYAWAQSTWHDEQGKPAPEDSSRKFLQGFSGMLLVTPDVNWKEKWNTPPETMPHFTMASEVHTGDILFILAFFSNPAVGANGKTDVRCDLLVTRPDGSHSSDQSDIPCRQAELSGDPKQVFLAAATIKYTADPTDLRGKWVVEMTLRDTVRGVVLPLETSFLVK